MTTTDNSKLAKLIAQAADKALADGLTRDNMDSDNPSGKLAAWIYANCNVPVEGWFFVQMLLAAELADRAAQTEGYASQTDKAAQLAFAK